MAIMSQNINHKSGYKQTVVGMIPEEWAVSTVGTEFEVQLGKMLDAEKNKGLLKNYIGNKAVQWGHIDISDLQMMAMSRSDLEHFRLRYGDLLVCEGAKLDGQRFGKLPSKSVTIRRLSIGCAHCEVSIHT